MLSSRIFVLLGLVLLSESAIDAVDRLSCFKCEGKCDILQLTICAEEETLCYAKHNNMSSVIEMGCKSENEKLKNDFTSDFHFCGSNNCNDRRTFETNEPLTCNSCSKSNCDAPIPRVCDKQIQGNKCFTRFDNKFSLIEMGCTSQIDEVELMKNYEQYFLCNGNVCNSNYIPTSDSSFKCNFCEDDCELYSEKQCSDNGVIQQCFIRFDGKQSVSRMGCKSDLNKTEIDENLNHFIFCEEEKCNNFSLIQENSCVHCNSDDQVDCASGPENLSSTKVCTNLANTNCYTLTTESGYTERGCVGELSVENYRNCISGNRCEVCKGKNCNKASYPKAKLACFVCNSTFDKNCLENPENKQNCPSNQVCVSKVIDNQIIRGCSEEVKCEISSIYDCETCNSNACNSAKLLNLKSVSKPGKWQSLPLTCIQCEGDKCVNSTTSKKCKGSLEQNCVTVFSDHKVLSRGCSDDVYKKHLDHCRNNAGNCHECKSNKCNNITSTTNLTTCLFCDSSSDGNCAEKPDHVSSTRTCSGKCMTALYHHPINNNYEVVRSCLNDKEIPEAEACNGLDCLSCAGDKCNMDILEPKVLSCNHCKGDCELYQSKKCTTIKKNDQCYIKFGESNSVIEMGCTSQFTEKEMIEITRNLLVCGGDNCNNYTILPQKNSCIECNSNTNMNCSTSPDKVTSVTSCAILPHSTCYSRVNKDGSTERGCLMKLPASDFNKCHFNTTSCQSCSGTSCNKEVFPANRLHCHRCNSTLDKSCKSTPNAVSVCPYYSQRDRCVTALDGKTIIRGCSSEISCNGIVCKHCSGQSCNDYDIEIPKDGFPGFWQDLPLNCFKCEGKECDNRQEILSACNSTNIYQNCVTIFGSNGKVAKRGCSDDLIKDCDAHAENCVTCKSSGCNNATSQKDYVDCLFCDSNTDFRCKSEPLSILNTRKCYKQCMVALYTNQSNVARTCLDDKDLDDREKCVAGEDSNCKACEGNKCNVALLPIDDRRLSCYKCDDAESCEIPESHLCPTKKDDDKCFVKFKNNEVVQMGCISQFDEDLYQILKQKDILVCGRNNCNLDLLNRLPKSQKCQACISSNNLGCATDPLSLGNLVGCSQLPYTQCYVKINTNGSTERGCLSELEGDDFLNCLSNNNSLYSSCAGVNCNNKVFPENRLRCHQCNTEIDVNCGKSAQGDVCSIFRENEICVSTLKEGVTYRGCGHELQCDVSDSKKCKVCSTSHCNIHEFEPEIPEPENTDIGEPGLWQDLPLNCYNCEGKDCESNAVLSKCHKNNMQVCTTVFGLNGNVEKRGCSDEVNEKYSTYCANNRGKCISCKSNGCNIDNDERNYIDCAYCDSKTNASCALGSNRKTRKCHKSCMIALYPVSLNDSNPAFEMTRTCLDDKEKDDQKSCDGELCKQCSTENCNEDKFPGNRRTCYRCQGKNCEQPVPEICSKYRANDVCYILVDGNNSIVEKGCGSDIMSGVIDELVMGKRLYTCNEDSCNSFEKLPEAKTCTLCNSKTDKDCAINPSQVYGSTKCEDLGYNQCYTRVLHDGHTERGCLSSLEKEEFLDCYKNTSLSCQSCVGDKCNSRLYPEDRISCNTCSSELNSTCTSSPDSPQVCLLYDYNQFCYSTTNKSNTIRGCGDESNCIGNKCNTCKGHNCNTIDFIGDSEEVDEIYGRFAPLPLDCYVCKENCSVTLGVLETCQGRFTQDCITVFGNDSSVITRGCSDQVKNTQNTYCNQNPDKCYTCKSNECNIAWRIEDYVDCISCDSERDLKCIGNAEEFTTRKCYKQCLNSLFSSTQRSYVHRGCLDDKDVIDQMLCDGKICEGCTGSACNKNVFPENYLQCYKCLPQDPDCASDPKNLHYCPTHILSGDKCVTYVNGNLVVRGCYSERICNSADENCLTCSGNGCNSESIPEVTDGCFKCNGNNCEEPRLKQCNVSNDECYIKYEGKFEIKEMGCKHEYENPEEIPNLIEQQNFYVCSGHSCNNITLLKEYECTVCNSETEKNCAINMNSFFKIKKCGKPYPQCYSRILDNGHTERGCIEDLANKDFMNCLENKNSNCTSCEGDKCNQKIYPENRLVCEVCEGDCGKTTSEICMIYKQEQCYVNYDETGLPESLGCSSDEEVRVNNWKNKKTLYECNEPSCNALDKIPHSRQCLVCDSQHNVGCAIYPEFLDTDSERVCIAPHSKCYTRIEGTKTVRGCLRDIESTTEVESCENGQDLCMTCLGDKCNNEIYPGDRLKCHICKDNENCLLEQTSNANTTVCPQYVPDDQCIAYYNKNEKFAERDCVSTNKLSCDINDATSCQKCLEPLCNKQKLNSASGIIASTTILLTGVFFAVFL